MSSRTDDEPGATPSSDGVRGSDRVSLAVPDVGSDEMRRVASVLESGMLADGEEVRAFEDEFASFCGVDHAVATSNGTTALHAALESLELGEGDRVLTTPFSFVASANAIRLSGATPMFADIDPATYALDPHAVEATLRNDDDGIEALLVVHLYGLSADMAHFVELCDEYDLLLIEDAAQAHGAEYGNDRVGSFGDAACFSFYPTKNMTTGEGGMITTGRSDVSRRAAAFVNHGRTAGGGSTAYEHGRVGHNFRMTNLSAAIGRVQLPKLPAYTNARRENAARLTKSLASGRNGGGGPGVEPPLEPDGRRHVYHQYTVRCSDRDGLRAHLDEHGVDTGVYYPAPIHHQPAYHGFDVELPIAERAAHEVLSLPVHPGLDSTDLETIETAIDTYETNE